MSRKDVTDAMIVQAVWNRQHGTSSHKYLHEILAEQTGQPENVCYRALERAERRGLIEYGVSLGTAWLTDAGEELYRLVTPHD